MRHETIARNYAGALLELGEKNGETDAFAGALAELDGALGEDPRIGRFLETPKIDEASKAAALGKALEGKAPERFLKFLLVVLAHHRQGLLHEIRVQYDAMMDEKADRMHAQVTLARPADDATVAEIGERLTAMLGRRVVPHVKVNPAIVGGIIVKYGDRVLDGSVRRQLLSMKREMMRATLPPEAAAGA